MYLSLCVLGILGLSASALVQPRSKEFYFLKSQYRRSDDCNMCYEGSCLPIEQTRCNYYEQVLELMPVNDEEPAGLTNIPLKNEVDNLIFNIIEKASMTPGLECIPYISRYSDCNKDNICIGCKMCSCTKEGRWNCSATTHCRIPKPAIDITHKILRIIIETLLKKSNTDREKRSVTSYTSVKNGDNMIFDQNSDWFFDTKPLERFTQKQQNTIGPNIAINENSQGVKPRIEYQEIQSTTKGVITEPEYLAFDEVLNNIAVDPKNYTRRKLPLQIESDNTNKTIDFDYMLIDEDSKLPSDTSNSSSDNMVEISYVVDDRRDDVLTESPHDEITKVVIDLLDSAKPNDDILNDTELAEMGINKDDLSVSVNNNQDIIDFSGINIMKRDVNFATETINEPNDSTATHLNDTTVVTNNRRETTLNEEKLNLKDNVLLPIIKILNQKQNDLYNLTKVKENLIQFMNTHDQSPIVEIMDYPYVSALNKLQDVEMFPNIEFDLRKTNPDLKQKFLFKLKSDIYEIVKDLLALERYRKGDLPDDLKYLINSLKRYVSITKPSREKFERKSFKNYRRRFDSDGSKCLESSFTQCIVEVLQAVAKNMPQMNALGSLSPRTRRIMRHIVRTLYTNELSSIALKVHDPSYNMSNDLMNIGSNWQDMSNIIGSSPFVTLYRMKLLHYFIEMDINTLEEALSLVAFAYSRRMTPYFKSVQNHVMEEINNGLNSIHNKVEIVVKYYSRKKADADDTVAIPQTNDYTTTEVTTIEPINVTNQQNQKKRSFIKYIRNLLKSSKKDIHELLHRQVPKSEIVKQLARKKLDELAQRRYNEYEEAMNRWQKNLGVMTRYRRSADKMSSRIKNIIPKYLRHKVNPKLHEKKNSSHKPDKKGKKKRKHGKQHKHKLTTLTTETTPKIKPTTPKKIKITPEPPKTNSNNTS